ncbi:hypothetical protein IFM89_014455 [Coptis chinensis]|uniref:Uncharacterized protein n=1 Tax=Coptis chinensis TaxID=261450 RepID=A0A835I2F2_9MAGN|nr:hypothetical protein IFM89_014455 [Coptis chinensis]
MCFSAKVFISGSGEGAMDGDGVYRPPRLLLLEEMSKLEKIATERIKCFIEKAKQSDFMRGLMDDLEGKPEEVKETFGAESRDVKRYKARMDERARQEEKLFTRAPLTKKEKRREKHLKIEQWSSGLLGRLGSHGSAFGNDMVLFMLEVCALSASTDLRKPLAHRGASSGTSGQRAINFPGSVKYS